MTSPKEVSLKERLQRFLESVDDVDFDITALSTLLALATKRAVPLLGLGAVVYRRWNELYPLLPADLRKELEAYLGAGKAAITEFRDDLRERLEAIASETGEKPPAAS